MTQPASPQPSRRGILGLIAAATGLAVSYGTLVTQGLLFLLPRHGDLKTRKLFVGRIDSFKPGTVRKFHDLRGNEILIKRDGSEFVAFNSTCPHLGCKVHWQEKEQQFFCPCHRGLFDQNGKGIAGPPADARQSLAQVPLDVDRQSGVIYIQVRDGGSGQ